ncbi:15048_t:CDS:1, partial [Dentiscutata heterogama]
AYLNAAAKNDEIIELNNNQVIEKITKKPFNTYTLARSLIYFHILKNPTISFPEIRKLFNSKFLPEATKIFISKFKLQTKLNLDDDLFFNPNSNTKKPKSEQVLTENSFSTQPTLLPSNPIPMEGLETSQTTME